MTDVTDATFATEVIERSHQVPVVVDLWAEWCGPCRTLGPILERVVAETDGAVELAKVDVDANPTISQQFKVQSIPAVYAVRDGAVVDGFVGALPEAQVREFVQRIAPAIEPSEVDRLLDAGDEASLRTALGLEPGDERVVLALAELLALSATAADHDSAAAGVDSGAAAGVDSGAAAGVDSGAGAEALSLLERIPESPETRRIAALVRVGPAPGGDEVLERLGSLLERVADDDEARGEFVDLLELLDEEERAEWRRRLSARLF